MTAKQQPLKTILILTVDAALHNEVADSLCLPGYQIQFVDSYARALSALEQKAVCIVFIDLQTPQAQELDLVTYIKSRAPQTEVVIIATIDELEKASLALRSGAALYLLKPLHCGDLQSVVEKLARSHDRTIEHQEMEQRILTELMGTSRSMQKILKLALKIAPTTSTVLIGGESGTGKEFFARIIHRMSPRYQNQFVAVNCGAIPDTLFESELFGHRKGAFTGADRDKPGLVEEAHMGTLFLDEIGELSASSQVKLLRFLQERSFRRIGETTQRSVNVRIIAATNQDLPRLIGEGKFREDLYYRLNIFYLHLPALRERKETLPGLIRLFLHKNNTLFGKSVNHFSAGAQALLAAYHYPGNVRELENILEHAVVLADGDEITERELPEFVTGGRLLLTGPAGGAPSAASPGDGDLTLAQVEKQHIEHTLRRVDNNYTEAARRLGISRSTLWRKLKEYGIDNG